LNAYLDTSVLVSMFTVDGHQPRLNAWLGSAGARLKFSDWTLTEFSSALAVGVRVGRLTKGEADSAEAALELWAQASGAALEIEPSDIRNARRLIRGTTQPLKAGDALHIAVALRDGCALATFDEGMRRAAADLGLKLEPL
jgi:uncharacterized protein